MKTIAYRYGLLDPINWSQDCQEQLFLMNRLWNTLVEIECKHREQVRALIGGDDAVKPLQERLDALREEQCSLRKDRKLQRQKARARVATAEIDKRLKEIAAEIQPLAAQTKEIRREAIERVQAPLQILDAERKAAEKKARQDANWGGPDGAAIMLRIEALRQERRRLLLSTMKSAERRRIDEIDQEVAALKKQYAAISAPRLWWGNANAVLASYQTARSKALKENAKLRFRRFTGEGRFTVQIINGASVHEIMAGKKQVSIDPIAQPVTDRKGRPIPRLSITIYTRDGQPRLLIFPIVYDRPLPKGCRIQQVVVTRRRCATRWMYAAVFTCRVESVSVSTKNQRSCALNLGFRQVPGDRPGNAALRVATLHDGQQHETLELSSRWMYRMNDVERIQQQRDEALNEITASLRAQWPERPQAFTDCEINERLGNLVRAPKFASEKLAGIVLRWRDQHADLWPQMLAQLERWRKLDKLDVPRQGGWEIQANKREKLLLQRREIYRLFARRIASTYGLISIGKMDLRQMAQLESQSGEENELHQIARRNRQRASLYQLQQEIKMQAQKFGTRVEVADGPFTITCHSCGGRCAVTTDIMHRCEHCSAVWDQDVNAAINILAAPRERSNGTENTQERSQITDQPLTRSERMRRGKEMRKLEKRSQIAR